MLVGGLATEWTASASGTGTWSCAGSNGGVNASCSAPAACSVSGGTALSPTSLTVALANVQCTQFNLGDGHYAAVTITRPNIIIKAVNKCAAIILPELSNVSMTSNVVSYLLRDVLHERAWEKARRKPSEVRLR